MAPGSYKHVLVCDTDSNRIQEFPLDGSTAARIVKVFSDGAWPHGITRIPDSDDVIITDWNRHRVMRFTIATDTVVWAVGSHGSGPEQFDWPYDVAVLPNGRVAVADCDNNRIQLLDAATVAFCGTLGCDPCVCVRVSVSFSSLLLPLSVLLW